ncbi:ornithine carbamoyltransferase [Ideonella sp. YS5]|uniref:ornithine carbamoyltransferase n=1 Tax=Ideonella sp. YS5 TaxID=3453714 RepID=UPI003EED771E
MPTLPFDFHDNADRLSDSQRRALAATALAFKQAAQAGQTARPLQGKNLGLICEADDAPDAALFEDAAKALGAHVVRIRPSVAGLGNDASLPQTARMLGRLYNAIECQGLTQQMVDRIRRHAGVPVYDALSRDSPSHRAVARMIDGQSDGADTLVYVLQALLVGSVP